MTNNCRTPKSETLLKCEALARKRGQELRVERPELDDDAIANMILATPEIAALMEQVQEELTRHYVEDMLDEDYFTYSVKNGRGYKWVISNDELLKMSDRELAKWAQDNGVMFAQLKAHLAGHFPETEGSA